jgi:hypothetical protein
VIGREHRWATIPFCSLPPFARPPSSLLQNHLPNHNFDIIGKLGRGDLCHKYKY